MAFGDKVKGWVTAGTAIGVLASGASSARPVPQAAPAQPSSPGNANIAENNASRDITQNPTITAPSPTTPVPPASSAHDAKADAQAQQKAQQQAAITSQAQANVAQQQAADAALEQKIYQGVDPAQLHPALRATTLAAYKADIAEGGNGFIVTDGFRNKAQQDEEVSKGYSTKQFGNSAHNYGEGTGRALAIDFAPLDANGQPTYSDPEAFKRIGNQFEKQGKKLGIDGPGGGIEAGVNWESPPDGPHVQFGNSPTDSQIANGADPYQWKKNLIQGGAEAEKAYEQEFNAKQTQMKVNEEVARLTAEQQAGQGQSTQQPSTQTQQSQPQQTSPQQTAPSQPAPSGQGAGGNRPVNFSPDKNTGGMGNALAAVQKSGVNLAGARFTSGSKGPSAPPTVANAAHVAQQRGGGATRSV